MKKRRNKELFDEITNTYLEKFETRGLAGLAGGPRLEDYGDNSSLEITPAQALPPRPSRGKITVLTARVGRPLSAGFYSGGDMACSGCAARRARIKKAIERMKQNAIAIARKVKAHE